MSYTTEALVRNEFFFLRTEEHIIGKASNSTTLKLKERCYSISSIEKNGVALVVTTDYTFQQPRTITLVVAQVNTDEFVIEFDTGLNSSQISALITKADAIIDSYMIKKFGAGQIPFSSTPTLIQEISTMLVGSYALQTLGMKNHNLKEPLQHARIMKKDAIGMLQDILDGGMKISEYTGTGTDPHVGRGGDQIFTNLEDAEDDYYDYFRAETKSERGELGPPNP